MTNNPSPLSECQSGYLTATAGNPLDPVHNTALPLLFDAPLAPNLLRQAIAALMTRHAMLRTAVRLDDSGTSGSQWTLEEPANWWQVVDARGLDRPALLERAAVDLRRPFDFEQGLFRATLYQGAEPGPLLLLAMHHIAGDAPTWGILGRELLACCAALAVGDPIDLPLLAVNHSDYVRWEQELTASDKGQRMAAYWQAQLAGDLPLLQLPTDHPRRPPTKTFNGTTLGLTLPDALTRAVHRLSGAQSCSRFSVLLAAWLVLLHQWTGQDDLWLLVPSSMPRQQPRFRGLAGLLISPVIVRVRMDQLRGQGFGALVRAVNGQLLLGLYHQPSPVIRLLQGRTDPAGITPLALRSMSAWEHSDFIPRHFATGGLRAERCDIPQLEGLYDAGLTFLEDIDSQAIGAGLSYNRDLFKPATIEAIAAQFQHILAQATAHPDQSLDRLNTAAPLVPIRAEG